MKTIGIKDLISVIDVAIWKKDIHFSQKMKDLLNSKIMIEVEDEDAEYIEKNYVKKD